MINLDRLIIVVGLCVFSVFSLELNLPENCTHSAHSRGCWGDGFNILSDYHDTSNIPSGKLVEYHLTISESTISPDGYERPGIVINGQYPGPNIEADWGDTLRIHVYNNLTTYNGTSIHWHGIRQWQTNWQDGVPGVTQCPIKPGGEQVYEFRATQYGSTYYHAHDGIQIADGLYGGIVIHGPASMNYDIDLGPWLIGDHYHRNVSGLDWIPFYVERDMLPPFGLINGKGVFDCNNTSNDTHCTGKGQYFEANLQKGKKYKIGLIGSMTLLPRTFWIDGHTMTVIQMDMVPVEPYVTDVLILGTGQRYEIIIEANADFEHGTDFWIHAPPCNRRAARSDKLGIIRYDENSTKDPTWSSGANTYASLHCRDPDYRKITPVVKKSVGRSANGMSPENYLRPGMLSYPDPAVGAKSHFFQWTLKDVPQHVDWENPALKQVLADADAPLPSEAASLSLDFETDEWVYFLIFNNFTHGFESSSAYHPMHLHGHDMAILAQGPGPVPDDVVLNLENPPRRDTVMVEGHGGYMWIAFQVNNPGAWLMHCHIASHALAGLSLQFIEQPRKIRGLMEDAGITGEFSERCDAWSEWTQETNFSQGLGSGV